MLLYYLAFSVNIHRLHRFWRDVWHCNVATPSLFATLQSVGAGGYGVAIVSGAIKTAICAIAGMVAGRQLR